MSADNNNSKGFYKNARDPIDSVSMSITMSIGEEGEPNDVRGDEIDSYTFITPPLEKPNGGGDDKIDSYTFITPPIENPDDVDPPVMTTMAVGEEGEPDDVDKDVDDSDVSKDVLFGKEPEWLDHIDGLGSQNANEFTDENIQYMSADAEDILSADDSNSEVNAAIDEFILDTQSSDTFMQNETSASDATRDAAFDFFANMHSAENLNIKSDDVI